MGAQANTMGPGYGQDQGPQMGFGFNPNTGGFIGGPGIAPMNPPQQPGGFNPSIGGGGLNARADGRDPFVFGEDPSFQPNSGQPNPGIDMSSGTPGGKSGGFGSMLGGVAKNMFGQIGNKIGQDMGPGIGAPINNMLSNIANRFPGQPGFQPQPGQPLPPGVSKGFGMPPQQSGGFNPPGGTGFGEEDNMGGLSAVQGMNAQQMQQYFAQNDADYAKLQADPTSMFYKADPTQRIGYTAPPQQSQLPPGVSKGFGMPPGGMTPQQQQQQAQQQYFNQSANARAQNTFGDGMTGGPGQPLPPGVSMGFGMPAPARAVSSTNAQMPGLMGGLLNNAQRPVARPAPRPAPLPVRAPAPAPATASRNIVSKYTRPRTRTR